MRTINVLSLGVGVQSSTLLMMANQGLLGLYKPDVAIFADTGNEPDEVHEYLSYLQGISDIPIIVQKEKSILDDLEYMVMEISKRYANPPFFTLSATGKRGMLMRICTKEYKIEQVEKAIRYKVLNLRPRQKMPKDIHVNMLIGISTDEIERVKPSNVPWITRVYPLIDAKEMSRSDCINWMRENGYKEPPRSACLMCPYHSDSEWARLMANPSYREQIIEIDERIRKGWHGLEEGMELFLHSSRKPISEVEFKDKGEGTFAEECEGMCGL